MKVDVATRRATAELKWDEGADPTPQVAGRSLHQYWPALAPYFRDVLVPPFRRPEVDGVAWNWRELESADAITTSELRSVRQRLAVAQELLAEQAERANVPTGELRPGWHAKNRQLVAEAMARVVAALLALGDEALRGYVCRTEAGPRVHSWGSAVPGVVRHGDTPSAGDREVETARPAIPARRRRVLPWIWLSAGVVGAGAIGTWLARDPGAPTRTGAKVVLSGRVSDSGLVGAASDAATTTGNRAVAQVASAAGASLGTSAAGGIAATGSRTSNAANDASTETRVNLAIPAEQRVLNVEPEKGQPQARADGPDAPASDSTGKGPRGAVAAGDSIERPTEAAVKTSAARREEPKPTPAPAPPAKNESRVEITRTEPTPVNLAADPSARPDGPQPSIQAAQRRDLEAEDERNDASKAKKSAAVAVDNGVLAEETSSARTNALTVLVRLNSPRWTLRLMQDRILATVPVRRGAPEADQRTKAVAEARVEVPAALRTVQIERGISLEISAPADVPRLRWRADGPDHGAKARTADGRAELRWGTLPADGEARWILEHEAQGVWAEVVLRADAAELRTIESLPARGVLIARVSAGEDASLGWRALGGRALANDWTFRAEGDERCVEAPLARLLTEPWPAFSDQRTGWAWVNDPVSERRLDQSAAR